MRVLYGVLSMGQGHVNRAAVVIRRLRDRGHRVDVVLSGDRPPSYARDVLGEFEHVSVPNLVIHDGQIARTRTAAAFGASLPARAAETRRLARRLARDRVDLVLTDFEPLTAWAAVLAGAPRAGISGQYRITRTNAPPPREAKGAGVAKLIMHAWTPPLTRYFAVSFGDDVATRARTEVVAPIVDDALRERAPKRAGFYLAYLYSYDLARVRSALEGHGVRFRVYGMGGPGVHGDIELRATDRASFVDDLVDCDGVILNGSFQGVCEAAALGKPILSIPFANQYEEAFNAHQVERNGLGMRAGGLTRDAIATFVARAASWSTPTKSRTGDGATAVVAALGL
jgi:uncharacterized protein (TIGR00661 family)